MASKRKQETKEELMVKVNRAVLSAVQKALAGRVALAGLSEADREHQMARVALGKVRGQEAMLFHFLGSDRARRVTDALDNIVALGLASIFLRELKKASRSKVSYL